MDPTKTMGVDYGEGQDFTAVVETEIGPDGTKVTRGEVIAQEGRKLTVAKLPKKFLDRVASGVNEGEVRDVAAQIYGQLPGHVLAKLQSIVRANGQNRHARRASAAILRRYFNGEAAKVRARANEKQRKEELAKTPRQRKLDREVTS